MKVHVRATGDFKNTERFLQNAHKKKYLSVLEEYGQAGVDALASATPKGSGKTAASWSYEIVQSGERASIYWKNSNVNDGVNIAVILEYGHGTGWGGYVVGREYIRPAIRPIFDAIADGVWKEVTD